MGAKALPSHPSTPPVIAFAESHNPSTCAHTCQAWWLGPRRRPQIRRRLTRHPAPHIEPHFPSPSAPATPVAPRIGTLPCPRPRCLPSVCNILLLTPALSMALCKGASPRKPPLTFGLNKNPSSESPGIPPGFPLSPPPLGFVLRSLLGLQPCRGDLRDG